MGRSADSLTALLCRNSSHSFLWFQLNDVMNFIPPFARRLVPGQNYPDYAILDFDHITDFKLRFVRSASNRMLKNGLGRNSAFFRFLLPEAEIHSVEGPT